MRASVFCFVALALLVCGIGLRADERSTADVAIKEAIKVLQSHLAKATTASEKDRISEAVKSLEGQLKSASVKASTDKPLEADIRRVKVFPEKYKGKTLELILWFDNNSMKKSEQLPGYYLAECNGGREGRDGLDHHGDTRFLHPKKINIVITAKQAEYLVDKVGAGISQRFTCIVKLAEENVGVKTYLIAHIVEMKSGKDSVK